MLESAKIYHFRGSRRRLRRPHKSYLQCHGRATLVRAKAFRSAAFSETRGGRQVAIEAAGAAKASRVKHRGGLSDHVSIGLCRLKRIALP